MHATGTIGLPASGAFYRHVFVNKLNSTRSRFSPLFYGQLPPTHPLHQTIKKTQFTPFTNSEASYLGHPSFRSFSSTARPFNKQLNDKIKSRFSEQANRSRSTYPPSSSLLSSQLAPTYPLHQTTSHKPLFTNNEAFFFNLLHFSSRKFSSCEHPSIKRLMERAEPVIESIIKHPFIAQMATEELPEEVFHNFLINDVNFLNQVIAIILRILARTDLSADTEKFFKHLLQSNIREKEFYEDILMKQNIKDDPFELPITKAYINFLEITIEHKTEIHWITAFLACCMTYNRIGKDLYVELTANPHNRYKPFFKNLNKSEFSTSTLSAVQILKEFFKQTPDLEQHESVFTTLSRGVVFEHEMIDQSYHVSKLIQVNCSNVSTVA